MAINKNSNAYIIIYTVVMVVIVGALLAILATWLKGRQETEVQKEQKFSIMRVLGVANEDSDKDQMVELFKKDVTIAWIEKGVYTPVTGNKAEEKAVFVDECWQLLSGAGETGTRLAGDFLLEVAKTIRGYGGSALFASQDLADFFDLDGGRFGKGIINNSKTKIILNLEDDEALRVQNTMHLSDAEVMEVTHFERGNGLISPNNNNIMVEFKASPLEKDLITTDRRELKDLVDRLRRKKETA